MKFAKTIVPGAGLPSGTFTHRSILPSSSFDPRNIFANDPPVERPDGTSIIGAYSDFFDPIESLDNNVAGISVSTLTGFDNSGDPGDTCSDWTSNSNSDNTTHGNTARPNFARLRNIGSTCNFTRRIFASAISQKISVLKC